MGMRFVTDGTGPVENTCVHGTGPAEKSRRVRFVLAAGWGPGYTSGGQRARSAALGLQGSSTGPHVGTRWPASGSVNQN